MLKVVISFRNSMLLFKKNQILRLITHSNFQFYLDILFALWNYFEKYWAFQLQYRLLSNCFLKIWAMSAKIIFKVKAHAMADHFDGW